ncbi:MAG: BON domain-containing protein [Planctomycetota bacterium]|nr:MAG: BON domain-containing protein [Planctomycetota bacterium]
MPDFRLSLIVAALLLTVASTASAQTNGLFGNSSPINRTSESSLLTGGMGRTGGTSGIGGQQTGAGIADPQISTELGALSSMVGQGSFVGQGNTAQGFVGSRQAGTQTQGASNRNFSASGFSGGDDFNQFNQQQGQGPSSRRRIQPQYRIAFERPPLATSEVNDRVQQSLSRLSETHPAFDGIDVAVDEAGTVGLRGTVQSDDVRRLVEAIVRLEPGVRDVQNELDIAADLTTP